MTYNVFGGTLILAQSINQSTPSFTVPSHSSASKWPANSPKRFGYVLLAITAGENDICIHQTHLPWARLNNSVNRYCKQ